VEAAQGGSARVKGFIDVKVRSTAGVASALMLLGAVLIAACSHGTDSQAWGPQGAVPVLVAKAEQKTIATRIRAIGRVEPYSTVEIKAQISGEVTSVHFKEGQDVTKGDLLFTIDPRPFQAALLQAKATLAKDEAGQMRATADEQRYASLLQEHVGSPQQFDQAHADADSLRATVDADKAAVRTAELNLAYTTIRAPIDGRTGNLLVHPGNLVKANADTGMVIINQIKPIYVDFSIPEQRLADVRRFMEENKLKVDATIPGQHDVIESGMLSFVDNAVDAKTGTIELKGVFSNQDNKLWPGQFVDATLTLDQIPNSVLVPSQAVQTGLNGSYVFVVDKQMKVETRTVTIGDNYEGLTVVESGIKPGETVVTDGQLRLIPGATVTIKHGLDSNAGAAS